MKSKILGLIMLGAALFTAAPAQAANSIEMGQIMSDFFGSGGGYNNIVVTANATAGYVNVAAGSATGFGTIYQSQLVTTNSGPKYTNEVGLLSTTLTIGPVVTSVGNPSIDLVECQTITGSDVNNTLSCGIVAGTPAGSPTAPAAQSGYIGIATFTVASGTNAVGTVTALPQIAPAFANGLYLNSLAGPRIYSATGAPTGACVPPSMYFRTNGSAGANIYVCTVSGTWTPIASV